MVISSSSSSCCSSKCIELILGFWNRVLLRLKTRNSPMANLDWRLMGKWIVYFAVEMFEIRFNWKQLNHKSYIAFISPHCTKLMHFAASETFYLNSHQSKIGCGTAITINDILTLIAAYTFVELSDTLHRKMNYFKSILIAFLLL